MAQQAAWAMGQPGMEDELLALEADTAAYYGRLGKARGLSHQAVASAERAKEQETAASYKSDAALREALFGNIAEARQQAAAALQVSKGRDVQFLAVLAAALVGDESRARSLADDLSRRFPEDTVVQFNYLPTLHAEIALSHSDSSAALDALRAAMPYELGSLGSFAFTIALYPIYARGEAYITAHQGKSAAEEFQKILDHRGVVFNEPIGPLAHLQNRESLCHARRHGRGQGCPSGKTPTLTSPHSSPPRQSTRSCISLSQALVGRLGEPITG